MSRLTDKQISNLIEDIRKIHSPTPASGEGSFAAPTGLGHNMNKQKPMNTIETTRGTPVGYINKHEAAKIMGCSLRTIDNWMKNKLIPYYKFGRTVFLKESDLMQAIEKHRVA